MSNRVIIFLVTCNLFSCYRTDPHEAIEIVSGRPVSFYLRHEEIPEVFKQLFTGVRKPSDEPEVLALFDSVFTSNPVTRPFYLATATTTMDVADGAYSGPLAGMAKRFVETRTEQFVDFVYTNAWLDDEKFEQWAQFVAWETNTLAQVNEVDELSKLANEMQMNCRTCNADQREILKEFLDRVRNHCPVN